MAGFIEFCKCTPEQICPLCKGPVIAVIAALCGSIGYLTGKRKSK